MLVINADDFGENNNINQAIVECFEKGFCSSATIMPNLPGFGEACQIVHDKKLLEHIGIHVVLNEGCPLTDDIRKCRRFCDKDGIFNFSRAKPTFSLGNSEKQALSKEVRAQIKECRDNGIPLTHMDSHRHAHTEWGIASVIIQVAKEANIAYLRLCRNSGASLGIIKNIYRYCINQKIKQAKLDRTRYFGSIYDYVYQKKKNENNKVIDSFEVMTHPAYDDQHVLIDKPTKKPFEKAIQDIDLYKEAVSFSGAKYV
jgi:predicted glycoside hydrolase/deacetylase ChbG (UPF0249 family)